MANIEIAFRSFQERNPYWSSFTCFANVVLAKEYLRTEIRKGFLKLVDRGDYSKSDKEAIIAYLISVSGGLLTTKQKSSEKTSINTGYYVMQSTE